VNQPYEVVEGTVADNAQVIAAVWSGSFELLRGELAQYKLMHSYFSNPAGSGPAFLLRYSHSQTVVGVQCIVLRKFIYQGRELTAGITADYAVDSSHRSLLPALQLFRCCIAGASTIVSMLYGFPNHKAEPVTKRAGFEKAMKLVRYAVPLRSASYISPMLPSALRFPLQWCGDIALMTAAWARSLLLGGVTWSVNECARDGVDAIWTAAMANPLFMSLRSSAILWWRFNMGATAEPGSAPWRIDVARAYVGGDPIGYVVWSLRGNIAIVGDFLCMYPELQTARVMAAFRNLARRMGAIAISLEYCGNASVGKELEKAGFSPRENSPLYVIQNAPMPTTDRWYFTGFDRDTD